MFLLTAPSRSRNGVYKYIKFTNICRQGTIKIFTNQDLELRGFLEYSTVVNRHTMQSFPSNQTDSFVLSVVRNNHDVSRELKM